MTQQRKPKGASNSTGGQFAGHDHSAPNTDLGVDDSLLTVTPEARKKYHAFDRKRKALFRKLGAPVLPAVVDGKLTIAARTADPIGRLSHGNYVVDGHRYVSAAEIPYASARRQAEIWEASSEDIEDVEQALTEAHALIARDGVTEAFTTLSEEHWKVRRELEARLSVYFGRVGDATLLARRGKRIMASVDAAGFHADAWEFAEHEDEIMTFWDNSQDYYRHADFIRQYGDVATLRA